ncbi:hypothetical protein F5Y11DRAFT_308772 [Daldinia sp. FL1419]|nr:hypothetical protein F5Y11DRAFT_308772 [Daldinia sp. FL1419]
MTCGDRRPYQPHPPMAAGPQHESLPQSNGSGNATDPRGGNIGGSKLQPRFVDLTPTCVVCHSDQFGQTRRGNQSGGPQSGDIALVPMFTRTPDEGSGRTQPPRPVDTYRFKSRPTVGLPTPVKATQDDQQRQNPKVGTQRVVPQETDSGEPTIRGGDTGNCLKEPCGCCCYWFHKVCCGDDD